MATANDPHPDNPRDPGAYAGFDDGGRRYRVTCVGISGFNNLGFALGDVVGPKDLPPGTSINRLITQRAVAPLDPEEARLHPENKYRMAGSGGAR